MSNMLHRPRGRLSADARVSFIAGSPDTLQPVAALPRPGLLVFVRHGESAANELNVFAGNEDVPFLAFVGARVALGGASRLTTRGASAAERRDARIAQQNPNVFLWVALAATGDAGTGFACLAAFLACLVAEN